jgi:hypothetical protein
LQNIVKSPVEETSAVRIFANDCIAFRLSLKTLCLQSQMSSCPTFCGSLETLHVTGPEYD